MIDGLSIGASELDFGEVRGDQDLPIRFTVQNLSQRSIQVDEFQTTCHCQPIEPKALTIPAGESREIRLTLDPARQPSTGLGRVRPVDTEIRPVIRGIPSLKAWKVTGTIRPLIETDIPAVLFGESNRVGQAPITRRVRVQFHVPGTLQVDLMPPVAEIRVTAGSAPTEWVIAVTPFTDRKAGPFRGTLKILNRSPEDNRQIASLDLPVEGVLMEGDK